jgi:hypothetical protein
VQQGADAETLQKPVSKTYEIEPFCHGLLPPDAENQYQAHPGGET